MESVSAKWRRFNRAGYRRDTWRRRLQFVLKETGDEIAARCHSSSVDKVGQDLSTKGREAFGDDVIRPQKKPERVVDEAYRKYVTSHNCLLLGKYGHVCSGPVEPHHVTPKMQGKVGSKPSDDRCLPFCEALHRQYHYLGSIEAFEQRYPVILEFEILRLRRAYKPAVKAKREQMPKVLRIEVFCACKRTHKLTPGKFNGGSFFCPISRQLVDLK